MVTVTVIFARNKELLRNQRRRRAAICGQMIDAASQDSPLLGQNVAAEAPQDKPQHFIEPHGNGLTTCASAARPC